jgi:hypothetical protein
MSSIYKNFFYAVYLISSVLFLDFLLGPKLIQILDETKKKDLPLVKPYIKSHPIYHHELNKDYRDSVFYTFFNFLMCTDQYSFRINCQKKNVNKNTKNLGIVFLGDSTTEGVGLNFEDTFFGMIEEKYSDIVLTNLSASSYSFSIYFAKLNYLINSKEFNIKKVVLVPDISDIQDEATKYYLDENNIVKEMNEKISFTDLPQTAENQKKSYNFLRKFPITFTLLRNLYYYDLLRPIYRYKRNYDRAEWTYNLSSSSYGEMGVENSIKKSIKLLEKTHKLLKKNNIDLSIVAFPQPSQILYDKEDSLHVEMLKNFCVERCKEFVNLYPIFFKFKNSMSDNDIIKKFYLKGDMHLNKEGNKIIAAKIIKDINF